MRAELVAFVRKSAGRDVSDRIRCERELEHHATHDTLTGMPNRALLTQHLGAALARGARRGHDVGLILADLDRFKFINDSAGPAVGDQLLAAVGKRLEGLAGEAGMLARLGGDGEALPLAIYELREQARGAPWIPCGPKVARGRMQPTR